jgi:signal transduction histidine kinase
MTMDVLRPRSIQLEVGDKFVSLITTEFRAMSAATVGFLVIGAALQIGGLLLIAAVGFASGCIRQLARGPARRGELAKAVAIFTGGLWFTTLFIVAVLPIALPVMVYNLVVPFIIAATYLDEAERRPITVTGVLVAGLMGVLGLTQPGLRLDDGVDPVIVDLVTIGFMVGYTWMFTATVRDANKTRMETLAQALTANVELVEAHHALRESRRRLIDVADQERGRIERNIHDGAQQRLVSASLQLKLLGQLIERGESTDPATVDLVHDEVTAALVELRELAQGIYPSLLLERGLTEAVGSLCRRSPLPATVHGEIAADLDPDLQAAAYFFCAEALQNATKHAGETAEVTIVFDSASDDRDVSERAGADRSNRALAITVSDTGRGFNPEEQTQSRGILNMVDRVEARDGVVTIESTPGNGTVLQAVLPVTTSSVHGRA